MISFLNTNVIINVPYNGNVRHSDSLKQALFFLFWQYIEWCRNCNFLSVTTPLIATPFLQIGILLSCFIIHSQANIAAAKPLELCTKFTSFVSFVLLSLRRERRSMSNIWRSWSWPNQLISTLSVWLSSPQASVVYTYVLFCLHIHLGTSVAITQWWHPSMNKHKPHQHCWCLLTCYSPIWWSCNLCCQLSTLSLQVQTLLTFVTRLPCMLPERDTSPSIPLTLSMQWRE